MQLGPDVADQLRDTALDGGVDVLVAGANTNSPGELLPHDVERLDKAVTSLSLRTPPCRDP